MAARPRTLSAAAQSGARNLCYLVIPADVSSIAFTTSLGWGSIGTWLEGRTVVVALSCWSMLFSCSGAIVRSLLETMYRTGLLC
jgi:hypothetical protein